MKKLLIVGVLLVLTSCSDMVLGALGVGGGSAGGISPETLAKNSKAAPLVMFHSNAKVGTWCEWETDASGHKSKTRYAVVKEEGEYKYIEMSLSSMKGINYLYKVDSKYNVKKAWITSEKEIAEQEVMKMPENKVKDAPSVDMKKSKESVKAANKEWKCEKISTTVSGTTSHLWTSSDLVWVGMNFVKSSAGENMNITLVNVGSDAKPAGKMPK